MGTVFKKGAIGSSRSTHLVLFTVKRYPHTVSCAFAGKWAALIVRMCLIGLLLWPFVKARTSGHSACHVARKRRRCRPAPYAPSTSLREHATAAVSSPPVPLVGATRDREGEAPSEPERRANERGCRLHRGTRLGRSLALPVARKNAFDGRRSAGILPAGGPHHPNVHRLQRRRPSRNADPSRRRAVSQARPNPRAAVVCSVLGLLWPENRGTKYRKRKKIKSGDSHHTGTQPPTPTETERCSSLCSSWRHPAM